MEFIKIEPNKDIDSLVSMASEIWNEYFGTFFDDKILPKLIEGAQSKRVILEQIKDGYQYFFIINNKLTLGYFAYQINPINAELFLGKIYIFSEHRNKGIGKQVLKQIEQVCHAHKAPKISLTVYHKNINSINAYEKWGFDNLGIIKRDFGNGLIFNDIKMEKIL